MILSARQSIPPTYGTSKLCKNTALIHIRFRKIKHVYYRRAHLKHGKNGDGKLNGASGNTMVSVLETDCICMNFSGD